MTFFFETQCSCDVAGDNADGGLFIYCFLDNEYTAGFDIFAIQQESAAAFQSVQPVV